MKILVFGSCNIDLVYSVKSIVRPDETLTVGELNQFPGGKGFNQAIAASIPRKGEVAEWLKSAEPMTAR